MKQAFLAAAILGLASASMVAGPGETISGEYVEARTAEVFAGGCVMNSEAETAGRQAVMAWKIERGSHNGVALDGLAIVAALSADRNLGMRAMGGEAPRDVNALFAVDARANDEQKRALFDLALRLSKDIVKGHTTVLWPAAITFDADRERIRVAAPGIQLTVNKQLKHDPSCGAMQWFRPLSTVQQGSMGMAETHVFSGSALGTKWSDPNKRSAFFAKFTY